MKGAGSGHSPALPPRCSLGRPKHRPSAQVSPTSMRTTDPLAQPRPPSSVPQAASTATVGAGPRAQPPYPSESRRVSPTLAPDSHRTRSPAATGPRLGPSASPACRASLRTRCAAPRQTRPPGGFSPMKRGHCAPALQLTKGLVRPRESTTHTAPAPRSCGRIGSVWEKEEEWKKSICLTSNYVNEPSGCAHSCTNLLLVRASGHARRPQTALAGCASPRRSHLLSTSVSISHEGTKPVPGKRCTCEWGREHALQRVLETCVLGSAEESLSGHFGACFQCLPSQEPACRCGPSQLSPTSSGKHSAESASILWR